MPIVTAQAELPKSAPREPVRQPSTNVEQQDAVPQEAAKPKEDPLSPKFAALAKQQKVVRRQQQELKAREDAFKLREAGLTTGYISKDRLKTDTLSALSEAGITPDELTRSFLNAPAAEDPTIAELRAKIKQLEDGQNQVKKNIEQKTTQEYDQAVRQIRNQAKMLVDSDPSYEMIKDMGQHEAVVELIKETFEKDGVLLDVEDAAKEIEEYLLEEALKVMNFKKIKARLNPEPATPVPQKQNSQQQQTKTLTNASTSSGRPLSARDRAIAAFKNQLK